MCWIKIRNIIYWKFANIAYSQNFIKPYCQTRVEDGEGEDEAFKLTISEEKDKESYKHDLPTGYCAGVGLKNKF